jgi:hypothetical protein
MRTLIALVLILPSAGLAEAGQHSGIGAGTAPVVTQGGTPPPKPFVIPTVSAPGIPALAFAPAGSSLQHEKNDRQANDKQLDRDD